MTIELPNIFLLSYLEVVTIIVCDVPDDLTGVDVLAL